MSDLKDTHYLDSIWFTYQFPITSVWNSRSAPSWRCPIKFNQTDRQAVRVFNLMTQVHQFEIILWPEDPDGFHWQRLRSVSAASA